MVRYLIKISKTEKTILNVTLKITGEKYMFGQQKVIRLCCNCVSDEYVITQTSFFKRCSVHFDIYKVLTRKKFTLN